MPTGDRCGSVVSLGVKILLSERFGGNQTAFSLLKSKGGIYGVLPAWRGSSLRQVRFV